MAKKKKNKPTLAFTTFRQEVEHIDPKTVSRGEATLLISRYKRYKEQLSDKWSRTFMQPIYDILNVNEAMTIGAKVKLLKRLVGTRLVNANVTDISKIYNELYGENLSVDGGDILKKTGEFLKAKLERDIEAVDYNQMHTSHTTHLQNITERFSHIKHLFTPTWERLYIEPIYNFILPF